MRLAALLLFLMGCAPAKPAPPKEATTTLADASVSAPASEDASAPALAATTESDKCSPTPCRVAEKATDITADGNDVIYLRTLGLKGAHQLVRRGPNDREESVLAMDVRPTRTARVRRMVVDNNTVFLATSEGIATWEKSGVVTVIGQTIAGAEQLAVDETNVYFMSSDCTLRKVAKTGGTVEEIVKGSPTSQYCGVPHVVLDDSNVYFTADDAVYAIAKSPKARAKPVKRLVLQRSERPVFGVTVDADNVYALLGGPATGPSTKGKLLRVSKKGGVPVELAKPEPVANPYCLGSDGTRIYWLENAQPKVLLVAMTKPSGERKVIGEAAGISYGIAVGKDNVFFATWEMTGPGSTPKVWRVTK